jgi:ABC-type transporter Mla subunit MlaD
MLSQGMDVFGQLSDIIVKNREGLEAAANSLAQAGKLLNELLSKLNPEDVRKLRDILDHLDKASADLEILTRQLREDLGPTLAETRRTMQSARPVIEHANKLLTDLDDMAQEIRDLPEGKKAEIRKVLERMTKTTAQLQDVIARMDAFTAMIRDQYSDLDRAKIEQILRQFFQEEGIKINVGEVKFHARQGQGR